MMNAMIFLESALLLEVHQIKLVAAKIKLKDIYQEALINTPDKRTNDIIQFALIVRDLDFNIFNRVWKTLLKLSLLSKEDEYAQCLTIMTDFITFLDSVTKNDSS